MDHNDSFDCWCEPVIIPIGENRVLLHITDDEEPPLSAVIEAIRLAQEA